MASPIEKDNVLITGVGQMPANHKKLFKYFGVGSKIKPPYRILNPHRIYIGDRTSIQENSHINAFEDLSFLMRYIDKKYRNQFKPQDYRYSPEIHIDRECQVGRFFFATCTARLWLHRNVLVSERVFIGDHDHTFSHRQVPIMQQPNKKGIPVEIGAGSWIGVGASLLKGTRLGVNCVVGANSVVEGVFTSHSVIGHPRARLMYRRHNIKGAG